MVASRKRCTSRRNRRCRTRASHPLQSGRDSDGQQSLQVAINSNEERYAEAQKAIADFFYFCNIPFNVARSPYFEDMVNALAVCGEGYKPPTYDDLRGPLLDECVEDMHRIIEEHKKLWVSTGCTIMFDGWTDEKDRALINILVASEKGLVFLKSVDASDQIKNGQALFTLLEGVVLEVGPQNVIQVITDNTTTYVAVGKLLEERFPNIFWTSSAAHCIDLIVEDIRKIHWVEDTMGCARTITKYIYNDSWVLNLMKQYVDGREIVRSGVTRFATTFLTLQSLYSERWGLKRMFVCNEWTESTFSISIDADLVRGIIFDEGFWDSLHELIQVFEPLVNVLHIVHSQDKAPMGYLYEAMNKVKKAIAEYYKNIEPNYHALWESIDRRWSSELHKPIHAAGYYLNPKCFFDEAFVADEEILNGLYICLEKMVQDEQKIADIRRELEIYRNAEGCLFSSACCISCRTTLNPAIWWESFGVKTPLLQQVAVRILSQPCSSFACNHDWSMLEQMHSKNCNKLAQERLTKMAFVHYNLNLHHKQIDGADHDVIDLDEIDPTSEWILEFGTLQLGKGDDFALNENQVAQELAAIDEAQGEAQTAATTTKGKGKKRAHD